MTQNRNMKSWLENSPVVTTYKAGDAAEICVATGQGDH